MFGIKKWMRKGSLRKRLEAKFKGPLETETPLKPYMNLGKEERVYQCFPLRAVTFYLTLNSIYENPNQLMTV